MEKKMPCRCDYIEPSPQQQQALQAKRLSALKSWDFTDVTDYLTETEGLTPTEASMSVELYRAWTLERVVTGGKVSPSVEVDRVLHAHILHTKDFRKFQDMVIGKFSHTPEIGYTPTQNSVSTQLVRFAQLKGISATELESELLFTSNLLEVDWGHLAAYLCSEECRDFNGTLDEAYEKVFHYLESMLTQIGNLSPENRVVWEAHILHTNCYSIFCSDYQDGFKHYAPGVI